MRVCLKQKRPLQKKIPAKKTPVQLFLNSLHQQPSCHPQKITEEERSNLKKLELWKDFLDDHDPLRNMQSVNLIYQYVQAIVARTIKCDDNESLERVYDAFDGTGHVITMSVSFAHLVMYYINRIRNNGDTIECFLYEKRTPIKILALVNLLYARKHSQDKVVVRENDAQTLTDTNISDSVFDLTQGPTSFSIDRVSHRVELH